MLSKTRLLDFFRERRSGYHWIYGASVYDALLYVPLAVWSCVKLGNVAPSIRSAYRNPAITCIQWKFDACDPNQNTLAETSTAVSKKFAADIRLVSQFKLKYPLHISWKITRTKHHSYNLHYYNDILSSSIMKYRCRYNGNVSTNLCIS